MDQDRPLQTWKILFPAIVSHVTSRPAAAGVWAVVVDEHGFQLSLSSWDAIAQLVGEDDPDGLADARRRTANLNLRLGIGAFAPKERN